MNGSRPTGITADRKISQLTITWDDGHVSNYPFSLLRAACPCAQCRGGHENMGSVPEPEVFHLPIVDSPAQKIVRLEPVGSYAITIEWGDGHHFGIYNWEYLRALCPCMTCRFEKSEDGQRSS